MPPPKGPMEATSVLMPLGDDAVPTVLLSHATPQSPTPAPQAKLDLEHGGARGLKTETDSLRRERLRAAGVFFLAAVGLFLVWRLKFSGERYLWPLNAAVMLILAGLLAALADRRPMPAKRLKAIELAMFGALAAFMAVRQFEAMRTSILGQEPVRFKSGLNPPIGAMAIRVVVKDSLILATIVTIAYTMLIPNTWRRAAGVVVTLMLVPVATQLLLLLTHPGAIRLAREAVDVPTFTENILFATVVSGLAIYGTYIINTLRVEAFEARQLNQYRLGDRIGAGGMGEVYRAEHRMLKRPCAIKLIKPDRASDAHAMARFEREVRSTARLTHPNTIEIYDYGHAEDGTFYYVMELLRGMTLEEIVTRFGPIPPGRVAYLLRQACDALAEAHSAGMIHRDIKPSNIFAAYRGGRHDVAKLLDFGLVKGGEEADGDSPALSREGTVRGTPHFMAPEQAMAEPDLDSRCDLYAVGAVAYCLLTGRPPFDGDSAARVMIGHARDPVEPPSRVNPEIPADVEAVVMRCLAKKREARYQTADELSEAFASCACAADWDHRRATQWWMVADPSLA